MFMDVRVPEQRDAWRTGLYEDRVLSRARRIVPDGGVFVDVGANIGFYACGVGLALLPRGGSCNRILPKRLQIYFIPGLAGLIKPVDRGPGLHAREIIGPLAGDFAAKALQRLPVGVAANAVGQNMFSEWDQDSADRSEWTSEEAPVIRLDEWSPRLERCDVVKIDVEGADLLVLRGAVETIDRFRPVVLAEFNPYWMKQIHQSLEDVRLFARRVDYEILRVFDDRFLPVGNHHADRDDEVPSYLLFPRERALELSELLS